MLQRCEMLRMKRRGEWALRSLLQLTAFATLPTLRTPGTSIVITLQVRTVRDNTYKVVSIRDV
jgi:hypothetical protein